MMTELQVANILQSSVVLAIWLFVIFKILPVFRVDSFRQKMFCVRDELFDFAADGGISFDDPAYLLLRQQMNGLIRYGHQLTVFRCVATKAINIVAGKEQEKPWSEAWESSLAEIQSEEVRARMKAFHERGMMIAVKHLIVGSPVLWFAILFAAVLLAAHGAALGARQLLKAAANKVFVGPLDRQMIENAAVGAFV